MKLGLIKMEEPNKKLIKKCINEKLYTRNYEKRSASLGYYNFLTIFGNRVVSNIRSINFHYILFVSLGTINEVVKIFLGF